MIASEDVRYCRDVLPDVSRTFALGIELLREPVRDDVGIAYLICRVLDTIEDTTDIDAELRAALLTRASTEVLDPSAYAACARSIESMFASPGLDGADHDLCRHASVVFRAFHDRRPGAREAMRVSISEMADGMAATVRRELAGDGLRLETMHDLERYCYYVAGTVGNLLTNLFVFDRASIDAEAERALRRHAVSFGLGLQVTNIIKNVTDDLLRGVAYVPEALFLEAGTDLETLVRDPRHASGRRVVAALVRHTLRWLDEALEYTLAIPAGERDLRLFCGLPLAFAVRTLGLAGTTDDVFSEQTLKITRDEVREIHAALDGATADDDAIRAIYVEERARVVQGLDAAL